MLSAILHATSADVDWSTSGFVRPVASGGCDAGPALVVAEAIESAQAVATGKLQRLSVQELVDCEQRPACSGGYIGAAYDFVAQHGLCTEAEYPPSASTCSDGLTCQAAGMCRSAACGTKQRIRAVQVPKGNESALAAALANGPVSLAVEADSDAFRGYIGGILDDASCGTFVNLPVLAVGYGTDAAGKEYWKLKNHWGTDWGEAGFVRIARGKNMCGVAQDATYPQLEQPGSSSDDADVDWRAKGVVCPVRQAGPAGFQNWASGSAAASACALAGKGSLNCSATPTGTPACKVEAWKKVPASELKKALAHGPVAAQMEAAACLQEYAGGVETAAACPTGCGGAINHGILLVGYSEHDNSLIAQNDWGAAWGEAGYLRFKLDDDVCGIADHLQVPVLA